MKYFVKIGFEYNGKVYRCGSVALGRFPPKIMPYLILIENKDVEKPEKQKNKIKFEKPKIDWNKVVLPDIVIPHHNRWDLIGKCLKAIPMCFKVFIVRGTTFAKACNMGAKLSKAKKIIFLNDDVVVSEEALWELCHKRADIVGCPLFIPSIKKTVYGMNMYWNDKAKDGRKIGTQLNFDSVPSCQIPVTGAMFMIKRKVFKDLGGFYEGYRNGGEDNELYMKAMERGHRFGFIKSVCNHYHSSSIGRYEFDRENHHLLVKRFSQKRLVKILGESAIRFPLISIIVPTTKKETPKYIESLKNQIYPNIEIIISRDLKKKGANWARNRGWERAKGTYLFFCDDDCEIKPVMLEWMENQLRISNASYAYCNYRRKGYEWNRVKDGSHFAKPWDLERLKRENYISTMSLIRARDFPKEGFDENIKRFQDWDLWLTMAEQGKYGKHINETLFTAHYDKDGISMNKRTYNRGVKAINKKHNL